MRNLNAPLDGAQRLNAFTVDVEDYYHVSAFEGRVARTDWGRFPSRVVPSTRRLLEVLADFNVKSTFFILGWVAEQFPSLVQEIDRQGHEIGSHSYWHRMVHTLTPEVFRQDLRRSKQVLEDVIGKPVVAFRAPSFSIGPKSLWALEILAEEGFRVDSSIFPVRHDRYGMPDARMEPHHIKLSDRTLVEFPPSVLPLGGYRLPVAGGGYFRLFPRALTLRGVQSCNRRNLPFMFYIHPWELDPGQPRIHGVGWKSRTRHCVNLHRTEAKLRWLLKRVRFGSMEQVLKSAESMLAEEHGDVQATAAKPPRLLNA